MPNIYYSTTYMLLYPHLMAKRVLKLAGNRFFFLIWGMKPANMGLWKYGGGTYNHAGGVTDLVIYLTNAKHLLFNNLHAVIPPLDGQTCLEVRDFFLIWGMKPAITWGCKSMVEGLTIMLAVLLTLLCTQPMPNIYYSTTYMLLYPHLMAKRVLKLAGNRDFFLIWGKKPANMAL